MLPSYHLNVVSRKTVEVGLSNGNTLNKGPEFGNKNRNKFVPRLLHCALVSANVY